MLQDWIPEYVVLRNYPLKSYVVTDASDPDTQTHPGIVHIDLTYLQNNPCFLIVLEVYPPALDGEYFDFASEVLFTLRTASCW